MPFPKRCAILQVIKKITNWNSKAYQIPSINLIAKDKTNMSDNTKCWWPYGETGTLLVQLVGLEIGGNTLESLEYQAKLKMCIPYDSAIPLLVRTLKKLL